MIGFIVCTYVRTWMNICKNICVRTNQHLLENNPYAPAT